MATNKNKTELHRYELDLHSSRMQRAKRVKIYKAPTRPGRTRQRVSSPSPNFEIFLKNLKRPRPRNVPLQAPPDRSLRVERPEQSHQKRRRHKSPDLPSLVAKIDEALEETAVSLLQENFQSLEQAHSSLTATLAGHSPLFEAQDSTRAAIFAAISAPITEELLCFETKRSKGAAAQVSLGDRMTSWNEKVEASERKVVGLWSKWETCQAQIVELSSRIENILEHRKKNGHLEGKELAERLKAKIASLCDDAVEEMNASEKKLALRSQKRRQEWAEAVGSQF